MKYNAPLVLDENNSASLLIKRIKPNSKVLEFGSAYGRMTKYMAEQLNCNVYIVEINKEAYNDAIKYAKDGICGDIMEFEWEQKFHNINFDYIIFADVLEHLYNPVIVMQKTKDMLKDDGSILLSLPNIAHNSIIYDLYHNVFNYTQEGILDNTHLRFYAYENIEPFCNSAGYGIVYENFTKNDSFNFERTNQIEESDTLLLPILMNRELGKVYQFIIEAKKLEYISKFNIKPIKIKSNEYEGFYVTAYYDKGFGFNENSKKIYKCEWVEGQLYRVKIDIPQNTINIRFDPVENFKCICKIVKLIDENDIKVNYIAQTPYTYNGIAIFDTIDPQYIFNETNGMKSIYVEFEVFFITDKNICLFIDLLNNYNKIKEDKDLEISEKIEVQKKAFEQLQLKENIITNISNELNIKNQVINELNQELNNKTQKINQEIENLRTIINEKDNYINSKNTQHFLLEEENKKNVKLYNEVINSKSWKLTKPLRILMDYIKLKNDELKYKIKKNFFNDNSIILKLNITNLKKSISFMKLFGFKQTIKKIKDKLLNNNYVNNNIKYNFTERIIPQGWIDIQRYNPKISVIVPIIDTDKSIIYFERAINSLDLQTYKNLEVCISGNDEDIYKITNLIDKYNNLTIKTHVYSGNNKLECIDSALNICDGELVCVLEQEDILIKNALFLCIEQFNLNMNLKMAICGDDCFITEGQFMSPDNKEDIIESNNFSLDRYLHFSMIKYKGMKEFSFLNFKNCVDELNETGITVIKDICYHYRISEDLWKNGVDIKPIAFYLPQFHRVKQNDEWWGEGFTEWTNVKRAYPMFDGHYQQREPGELGYYDLIEQENMQRKQIDLAKKFNLYGFCYYYYWFDGDRLLEKPMDKFLADKSLDFPFCICWANENWTRRWDGLDNEILMKQNYEENWGEHLFDDIVHVIKDERYICIDGAPLILIYKPHLINNLVENIKRIRELAKEANIDKLCIGVVKHPETKDPLVYGADIMVEFPPHGFSHKDITDNVKNISKGFSGRIYDYRYAATNYVQLKNKKYTLLRTSMLAWDNTARKLKNAYIFHNFSSDYFKLWLYLDIRYTKRFNGENKQIIFINAWNEWSEGTYLEPDKKFGLKYLETLNDALKLR